MSRDLFGIIIIQCGDWGVSCRRWTATVPQHRSQHTTVTTVFPLLITLFPTLFLILSYRGSLPAEMLVCGLHSSLLVLSTQFSKRMTRGRADIMSSPIHHPGCQPFNKSNQQAQQDHSCSRSPLFNRATVSIVISPETFLKFN